MSEHVAEVENYVEFYANNKQLEKTFAFIEAPRTTYSPVVLLLKDIITRPSIVILG
jgi:hypothetical protein